MTVSPETPVFESISTDSGYKTLAEDHLTFVNVGLGLSLMIHINAGYATDGCSVPTNLLEDKTYGNKVRKFLEKEFPEEDPESALLRLVGGAWDMPRLLAAIVHDALYDLHWSCRWFCDMVYRRILVENKYNLTRAGVEYSGIRLVGGRNWDAVTDLDIARAKERISVKLIKTSNKDKYIEKWS